MTTIRLPSAISHLYRAHRRLQKHFAWTELTFTLDGKLVGDIGEAIAAANFGVELCARRTRGVDGHAPDGRSVQVKATGRTQAGPAYSSGEGVADHLLFFRFNFERGTAEVAYNGPEAPIREMLPGRLNGTRVIPLANVLDANAKVEARRRLKVVRRRVPR